MNTPLLHPVSRRLFGCVPDDTLEPLATLANTADLPTAFRDSTLRQCTLALGARGAYLLEESVDADHGWRTDATRTFDRCLSAVRDGLADEQRAVLGLVGERLAALDMLDELRGLFAMRDLAGARRLGAQVLAGLVAHFDASLPSFFPLTKYEAVLTSPEGEVGEATLGRPVVRDASQLAILVERAFGALLYDPFEGRARVRQILRAAADLDGDGAPRAPHEERSRRGVSHPFFTGTDLTARVDGIALLELPCGLVHPAQRAALAERLGCTLEELATRLADESQQSAAEGYEPRGPRVLARELGAAAADLFIHAIPIIPEAERPPRYFLARSPEAADTRVADPIGAAYRALEARLHRWQRYAELGAQDILMDVEACELQVRLDELFVALAAGEPTTAWVREIRYPDVALASNWIEQHELMMDDPDTTTWDVVPTAVWLDRDRVAIGYAGNAWIVDLTARRHRVVRSLRVLGARLQTCDASGRYLLVGSDGPPEAYDPAQPYEAAAIVDTQAGEWQTRWPAELPAVLYGGDQPEDGAFYDLRRDAGLDISSRGDRPACLAFARGNSHALVSGDYGDLYRAAILDLATGFEVVSNRALEQSRTAAPTLLLDGTLVAASADDDADHDEHAERWEDRMYQPMPSAIVQVGGDWRFLAPSRQVCDVGATLFRIGWAFDAAAFSPDGERLLVVGDDVVVVDVRSREVTWRMGLSELSG